MNGNGYNQIGTINLPSNGWLQLKITLHYFIKTNQDMSEPCSFMIGFFVMLTSLFTCFSVVWWARCFFGWWAWLVACCTSGHAHQQGKKCLVRETSFSVWNSDICWWFKTCTLSKNSGTKTLLFIVEREVRQLIVVQGSRISASVYIYFVCV